MLPAENARDTAAAACMPALPVGASELAGIKPDGNGDAAFGSAHVRSTRSQTVRELFRNCGWQRNVHGVGRFRRSR